MRNTEHELQRDAHASDGDLYAALPGDPCKVPSQGEIGSLIAVTAAANLTLAHRRSTHRRPAPHEDATGKQGSH
ncbi:hypothetical protein [Streptomyces sp. NPDC047043]|uniref:hypothetical protein n=1 Tax=Streptomyces sp. NPDC047043 TaxID=3154497 RepID=UPI0033D5A93B